MSGLHIVGVAAARPVGTLAEIIACPAMAIAPLHYWFSGQSAHDAEQQSSGSNFRETHDAMRVWSWMTVDGSRRKDVKFAVDLGES